MPLPFVINTVNEQVAWLAAKSVALQYTSVKPTPNWLPDSTLHVTVGSSPELSATFGSIQTATAVDWPRDVWMFWLEGHTIAGASESRKYQKYKGLKQMI